ncbi:DUF4382 domain-containing protein [uncultured Gelidibacter sp.]|uniref:DUF4382 domain-containing protein n=1 Tax=uncultured Gelidibacter sp. TaxID=259318 RepID=UPI00261BB085|nr:DUF4382 domain-containing protein [uncultured Gelidibacter sp.]
MKVMKNMKFGAMALGLSLVFTACSSDDSVDTPLQGSLKIAAKANYNNVLNRSGENAVSLSKFIVNFKEIELERSDADEDLIDGFFGSDDDIELKGPFEIDLLSGNSIQLATVEIPNGIYEEIEFEFDKSENEASDLYGKSMKLTGEINGQPFVFWHDFEEEIEIDYEDSNKNLVIDNNTKEILINFDLNAVMDMIDLSTATDTDGDGLITISPDDEDGNNDLAELIKEAIKTQIDLMEDQD